jgi:hypothetical protein
VFDELIFRPYLEHLTYTFHTEDIRSSQYQFQDHVIGTLPFILLAICVMKIDCMPDIEKTLAEYLSKGLSPRTSEVAQNLVPSLSILSIQDLYLVVLSVLGSVQNDEYVRDIQTSRKVPSPTITSLIDKITSLRRSPSFTLEEAERLVDKELNASDAREINGKAFRVSKPSHHNTDLTYDSWGPWANVRYTIYTSCFTAKEHAPTNRP